ncbi:MAG: hypothetical protein AABW59_05255 [archaeon]
MEMIEERIQLIAKELSESNATQWTITKIIKALSEMNVQNEKKLREKALQMLKELDPNAANVFERFSEMRVYSTNETVKGFNRGNIITSLLKETSIPRTVGEKITLEVENNIKDSKISFLTAGLIRELVNAKLISYGLDEIRNHYTRVGEPVFEVKKKLDNAPYDGEAVREYNILLALPKNAREMHFEGTIHIEDIEGFSHRPFAYSFIASKKETLEKTIAGAMKTLVQKRKYFYLPANIYGLSFACAPFAASEQKAKHAAELIKEFAQVPEKGGIISLELFTPSVLEEMAEYKLNAAKISDYLVGEEGYVLGVDTKYCLKLIGTKGKTIKILNNSSEEYFPLNNNLFAPTQGIDLFVNINLEKIAQDTGEEKEFFERLRIVSNEIEILKKTKKELLSKKSYLKDLNVEEMKTGIGFTSIMKASENFEHDKKLEFANKLAREANRIFPEDLLFGLGSEKAKERFQGASKKEIFSQEALDFEECLSSKRCCFTGKATSIKEVNELLDNKVKQIELLG